MSLSRQHLIDPEICIRCNTCEEMCPIGAVTHNDDNYVVNAETCNHCLDCIAPCPTGAIDNWRMVTAPHSVEAQFEWLELPEETRPEATEEEPVEAVEDEARELLDIAHQAQGGHASPPFSAAHPYVNLYARARPAIATVTGNVCITDGASDIHHIILDLGGTAFPVIEGQSVGVLPPGETNKGRPHQMRLYSIASPRDGERPNHNNIALTVKRVVYEKDGAEEKGVASNYLCDLKRGDEVALTGPFGDSFLMPNHPEANIIMICTGTGAAPFRAFTERRRRRRPDGPGKLMLFFGARTPEELPYFGPLQKLPKSLMQTELVFSRLADREKEYVQDRMRTRAPDIAALLKDENTFIFICGLKGMEAGVADALSGICAESGQDWQALSRDMTANGRYHVETY